MVSIEHVLNSIEIADQLESAGFDKKQAKAIVLAFDQSLAGDVATRSDIVELRSDIDRKIDAVQFDLEKKSDAVRFDLEKRIIQQTTRHVWVTVTGISVLATLMGVFFYYHQIFPDLI